MRFILNRRTDGRTIKILATDSWGRGNDRVESANVIAAGRTANAVISRRDPTNSIADTDEITRPGDCCSFVDNAWTRRYTYIRVRVRRII